RHENALNIPFWALNYEELIALTMGRLTDSQSAAIAVLVTQYMRDSLRAQPRSGITDAQVTVDTPIPFSLHKLWFELHKREHHTLIPKPGGAADEVEPAYVLDTNGDPIQLGDELSVTPPLYRT